MVRIPLSVMDWKSITWKSLFLGMALELYLFWMLEISIHSLTFPPSSVIGQAWTLFVFSAQFVSLQMISFLWKLGANDIVAYLCGFAAQAFFYSWFLITYFAVQNRVRRVRRHEEESVEVGPLDVYATQARS